MSGSRFEEVMARRNEIVRRSVGIDYAAYATGTIAFDYERLLSDTGYGLDEIREVQSRTAVGSTPLVELTNLTAVVRAVSPPDRGARIFVKDEAANPSGSFKDRRASLSIAEAVRRGYPGVAAATRPPREPLAPPGSRWPRPRSRASPVRSVTRAPASSSKCTTAKSSASVAIHSGVSPSYEMTARSSPQASAPKERR